MKYRAILFDVDGLVLIPQHFSEAVQRDYGISWEKMDSFFSGPFKQCKLGRVDLKEELAKVIGAWRWQGSVEELMTYWFSIGSELNPDVSDLVAKLREAGVMCYLSTNNEKYRMQYLWETVGLEKKFDGLIVSSEIGHLKNESEFFESAYKIVCSVVPGIERKAILVIDHERSNLDAATESRFATYLYQDFQSFHDWLKQL